MIVQASKDLPNVCHVDSHMHLKCKWSDGVVMANLKAKNIYRIIDQNKISLCMLIMFGTLLLKLMFGKNILITYGNLLLNQKLNVLNGLLCWIGFLLKEFMLILIYVAYASFLILVDTFYLIVFLLKRFGKCLVLFILLILLLLTLLLVIYLVFIRIQINFGICCPLTSSGRSGNAGTRRGTMVS